MPAIAYRLVDTGQDVARVEWDGEPVRFTADETIPRQREQLTRPKRTAARDFILEKLAGGDWIKVSELDAAAKAAGIAVGTFRRAKSDMKQPDDDGRHVRYSKDGGDWFVKLEDDGGAF